MTNVMADAFARQREAAIDKPAEPVPTPLLAGGRRPYPYLQDLGGVESLIDRKCSRCGAWFRIRCISKFVLCRSCWESMDCWPRGYWARWRLTDGTPLAPTVERASDGWVGATPAVQGSLGGVSR